jgi:hypothetical protein
MPETAYGMDFLSTREGCNLAVRQIEALHLVIERFERFENAADTITNLIASNEIVSEQVLPMLNSLLVDKYRYSYLSHNLERNIDDFGPFVKMMRTWNAFDIVLVYFHPELGVTPINPKNVSHWNAAHQLVKSELVTIFVGEFADTRTDDDGYADCIDLVVEMLAGKFRRSVPDRFLRGKCVFKEPLAPRTAPKKTAGKAKTHPVRTKTPAKKKESDHAEPDHAEAAESKQNVSQMTKMYGITVTNELFHNGNVEAWKRIIRSYNYTYPDTQVIIYYDHERINNINTLFQWGKVKRGKVILIALMGKDIRDFAKLRRYLEDGASVNFGRFIKGNPVMILQLFG